MRKNYIRENIVKFFYFILNGYNKQKIWIYGKNSYFCAVKIVLRHKDKVLVAKQISKDSISKICLPGGYVELSSLESNSDACRRVLNEKLNLSVDSVFFNTNSLLDVKIEDVNGHRNLIYIYEYTMSDQELSQISDTHALYDAFLLDFKSIIKYKNKEDFVSLDDYTILDNLQKGSYNGTK